MFTVSPLQKFGQCYENKYKLHWHCWLLGNAKMRDHACTPISACLVIRAIRSKRYDRMDHSDAALKYAAYCLQWNFSKSQMVAQTSALTSPKFPYTYMYYSTALFHSIFFKAKLSCLILSAGSPNLKKHLNWIVHTRGRGRGQKRSALFVRAHLLHLPAGQARFSPAWVESRRGCEPAALKPKSPSATTRLRVGPLPFAFGTVVIRQKWVVRRKKRSGDWGEVWGEVDFRRGLPWLMSDEGRWVKREDACQAPASASPHPQFPQLHPPGSSTIASKIAKALASNGTFRAKPDFASESE